MFKPEKLVVTKQYIDLSSQIEQILDNGENVSVIFPPISDCQRRITQFIEEHSSKYLFLEVSPLDVAIEEVPDLENSLLNQAKESDEFKDLDSFEALLKDLNLKNKKIVIISPLADFLFTARGSHFLTLFHKTLLKYSSVITYLLQFEIDIVHPSNAEMVHNYHLLFQHIIYYPLYSPSDTMTFIDYLCDKWKVTLDIKSKNEIIKKCGGYFWLVKEAIRQIRDSGSWSTDSEQLRYRLETIAGTLKESEYTVVTKTIGKSRSLNDEEIHSQDFLKKIGFLDSKNNLTAPLLKEAVVRLGSSSRKLVLEDNKISLNQVPVTNYFSRKEYRVIKLLLSHEGEIVSRDKIAEAIWPMDADNNFSEWAIDQLIKRLRDRLSELLIPKTTLKSVRGKGYLYG